MSEPAVTVRPESPLRKFLRENSLTLFFLAIFIGATIGTLISGWREYNADATQHGEAAISLGRFFASSQFGRQMLENWQSEYLQFLLYIIVTVWLVQKGSPESQELEKAGRHSDEEEKLGQFAEADSPRWARLQGGARRFLYSNSLALTMGAIFLLSWLGQSLTGWTEFNDEQMEHKSSPVSWVGYLARPTFWNDTFQNWQSEFLAIASMVAFSIYLRQRASPESKRVGESHEKTGGSA